MKIKKPFKIILSKINNYQLNYKNQNNKNKKLNNLFIKKKNKNNLKLNNNNNIK